MQAVSDKDINPGCDVAMDPLLSSVSSIEGALRRRYATEDILFSQGSYGNSIYWLLNGIVELSAITVSGSEKILILTKPGSLLGEANLIGKPHSVTAITKSRCELLVVPLKAFESQLQPSAVAAMKSLAERLSVIYYHVLSVGHSSAHQRVMFVLWSLAGLDNNVHIDKKGEKTVPIKVTQEYIGRMAGVSRQTVGEVIHYLTKHNIIARPVGQSIMVKDMYRLRSLLEQDEVNKELVRFFSTKA